MRFAKARLFVALVTLFAWVGYIAYQAIEYGRFPVVSHAQLLNSSAVVVAELEIDGSGRPAASVRIVEVLWPDKVGRLAGETIAVRNLPRARLSTEDAAHLGRLTTGRYILPLREEEARYLVAGLPRSPGFEHADPVYFIYPDVPIVREQLTSILKAAMATAPRPAK
jgi:hypothetical protein